MTYKEMCASIITKCADKQHFSIATAIKETYDECETEEQYQSLYNEISRIGEPKC